MCKFISVIYLALLFLACASVDELIESGQYDQAIKKGIHKLEKTPNDEVSRKNVITAYQFAQKKDLQSIKALGDMEESALNYERMYKVYSKMQARDNLLQNSNIKAPIESKVPQEEMLFTHENMCLSYANNADEKMQRNTRESYQEAYKDWNKILQYACKYNNVDSLMNTCVKLGKAIVVLQIEGQKNIAMPENTRIGLSSLSYIKNNKLGKWVKFTNEYELDENIDYTVICTFNQISISENELTAKKTEVKKKIIDRYETRKNAEGKMQEFPVYVTVTALVKEFTQKKNSTQGVYFEIVDNDKGTKIYQKQLVAFATFNHKYSTATGDLRALSKTQIKAIKVKKIPYPNNSSMVEKSGKELKKVVENEIYRQRKFFK